MEIYDIVIAGGGTAGCAAAYTAGKLGFKTLLIEKNIHLGGTITSGLVVPSMNCGENQINTDFFDALCAELRNLGGQITYQDNRGWFNPELAKIALDNLMKKAGVEVFLGTTIEDVELDGRVIKKLFIKQKMLSEPICEIYNDNNSLYHRRLSLPIEARYVIDATGNLEIAKICDCDFLQKENELQPVSLRFIMGGVDLKKFAKWLLEFDKDRSVTTVECIDGFIYLSTAYTWDSTKKWALKPLFDEAVTKGVLKDTDRNYFQIFSVAGMYDSVAFNCPRIIDCKDYSKALTEGRQSILRLSEFCKIYLPGFKKAYISNIADMLGIRVSSRIKGKYIYTIDDLKSGKRFENPVLISNYPVDVHSDKKDNSTLEVVKEYMLPVESLISADIDNLYVAGRVISADFLSQGALRVQPSCFAMGEGLVKYIFNALLSDR